MYDRIILTEVKIATHKKKATFDMVFSELSNLV